MEILDRLGDIYSEALSEVISTIAGIQLQPESQENDTELGDITGVMILKGTEHGLLYVSARVPDVRILCSHIIGIPAADVTDSDLDDTMCELVNMTAGSAKLRLSDTDYMFKLTQPFVIKGKDVSLVTKSITNVISCTLSNSEITVKLKVVY